MSPGSASASDSPAFSLLFFGSSEPRCNDRGDCYAFATEAVRYADRQAFEAVWIPERHFHRFGGIFPSPAVLGAALAVQTTTLRIRAGSVVLPLHHPLRVAEEWAMVDRLSNGRVDIAFAQGWAPQDFVLAPNAYADRLEHFRVNLDVVRRLWRGEALPWVDGEGRSCQIQTYPPPCSKELSPWITCSGGADRFREAGALGANVLTALLFQKPEELAVKLDAYRSARAEHGHDPDRGRVTLMLHTYVDDTDEKVREIVRESFIDYLRSSVTLWRHASEPLSQLDAKKQDAVLNYAFDRYYRQAAMFGTPTHCASLVQRLQGMGVNEIACLIDFGLSPELMMNSLHRLNEVRSLCIERQPNEAPSASLVRDTAS